MFVNTMSNANMNLKKIAIQSLESSQINLDALYAIAPSCFTEVKGDDGQLTRKVDFDALRELLGGDIADAHEETFGFQWVGKQETKRTAAAPTHNTLRPVMAEQCELGHYGKSLHRGGQPRGVETLAACLSGEGEDDLHRPAL